MQNYYQTRHLHGTEKSITYYFISCTLLPITLSIILYYLLLYQLYSITYYFISCTLLPITLSVVLYYLLLHQLYSITYHLSLIHI